MERPGLVNLVLCSVVKPGSIEDRQISPEMVKESFGIRPSSEDDMASCYVVSVVTLHRVSPDLSKKLFRTDVENRSNDLVDVFCGMGEGG